MKPVEIINNDEIEHVHGHANFGCMGKRQVVNQGVLKCASGYYQGHTSRKIITELESSAMEPVSEVAYRTNKEMRNFMQNAA